MAQYFGENSCRHTPNATTSALLSKSEHLSRSNNAAHLGLGYFSRTIVISDKIETEKEALRYRDTSNKFVGHSAAAESLFGRDTAVHTLFKRSSGAKERSRKLAVVE